MQAAIIKSSNGLCEAVEHAPVRQVRSNCGGTVITHAEELTRTVAARVVDSSSKDDSEV